MKTLFLILLSVFLGFLSSVPAQSSNYLIKIDLNIDNDKLNELEKIRVPVLHIIGNNLLTVISNDQYESIIKQGIPLVVLEKNTEDKNYYLITRKDKQIIKESFGSAALLFKDGSSALISSAFVNAEDYARQGYSITLLNSSRYFRNEKTLEISTFSPTSDSLIGLITSMVNKDSVEYFIQSLQDFGTRFLLAPNRDSVSEWIMGEFLRMGYTDVKLDSFEYNNTWQKNVVATLQGTTQPNSFVVTGGHHDSYSSGDPLIFAPGADDNASGTAAVLETARVLKAAGYQSEMTIKFITFAAEEYGLWGSKDYADKAVNEGMNIKLMINHDMISHTTNPASTSQVDINYYTGSEPYRELAKQMVSEYSVLNPRNGSQNSGGSDSHSFWTRGYHAVYFEETQFSPYYHSPQDIITNYNMDYCAEVIKASVATLISAIVIPDQVKNFSVYDLGSGTTVLAQWSANNEPDLAGYKIYLGTSSGNYTQSYNTTDTSYTLTGLIDGTEYFIAIRAVDMQGNESIIVERSIIPKLLPLAPVNFSAKPEWHQVRLQWSKNNELDLQGYNVYRSTELTGEYLRMNQNVLTDTMFIHNTAQNGIYYFYYVKAVDLAQNEGNASITVKSRVISLDQGILIVDETEDGNGTLLNPTDEQVDEFYTELLDGFRFQQHDIKSDGPPQLADLGAFSTIIWSAEDGSNYSAAMSSRELLTEYMQLGGNFLYSGYRPIRAFQGSLVYPAQMEPGSFVYDMLKIKDVDYNIFARFFGGVPVQPGYNYINIDSAKTLPVYFHHLANIESIGAAPSAEEIYTYDTKYDTSTAQAIMKGLPVAVEYIGNDYKVITLSFPLYYMNKVQGKDLLDFILLEKFDEVTSVEVDNSNHPKEFLLSQNYPNPFNPATVIRYSLPYGGHVNLSVYDILGRETALLVNEIKSSGVHSVKFDGNNLSSGIYFYKLKVTPSGGGEIFTETRKMMLIK